MSQSVSRLSYFVCGVCLVVVAAAVAALIWLLHLQGLALVIIFVLAVGIFLIAVQIFGWVISGGPRHHGKGSPGLNIIDLLINLFLLR